MQPSSRSTDSYRALMLCALACASGCVSGRPFRGVEVAGTHVPPAGHPRRNVPVCRGDAVSDAWAPPGFCVTRFADNLIRPRHLVFAPDGDLFVTTREGVMVLWDSNGDGVSDRHERARIGGRDLSNQGIAFSPGGAYLYYASDQAVLRIPYHAGLRQFDQVGEIVIPDLPGTIDHPYKSITFDREGRLYVMVGARDNLMPGAGARIVRYVVPQTLPALGMPYSSGEVFAQGLRNAEALAWSTDGALWAFVNGRDDLHPPNTPPSFSLDHPGDWIYRLSDTAGTFYGFPNCWVLGAVPWGDRRDPVSQWADPEVSEGNSDAWCQDPANVHPAAGALPAHTAPLGAVQYNANLFPSEYRGDFFVASHGSWDRHGAQIGRTILRVRTNGDRVASITPLVGQRASDGDLREGRWSERPVGITTGPDGALYIASDETGHILRVGYAHE